MKKIGLSEIKLLDIGNTIQLTGAIYTGNGHNYVCALPGELAEIEPNEFVILDMDNQEWQDFLRQSDVVDREGPNKAIFRKSQRQIDSKVNWGVFRRDNYQCRYCGDGVNPLTVDHIILWEEGGVSIPENLLAACKPCNRSRGNTQYEDWITSDAYKARSKNLTTEQKLRNIEIVNKLPYLRTLTTDKQRSR